LEKEDGRRFKEEDEVVPTADQIILMPKVYFSDPLYARQLPQNMI